MPVNLDNTTSRTSFLSVAVVGIIRIGIVEVTPAGFCIWPSKDVESVVSAVGCSVFTAPCIAVTSPPAVTIEDVIISRARARAAGTRVVRRM